MRSLKVSRVHVLLCLCCVLLTLLALQSYYYSERQTDIRLGSEEMTTTSMLVVGGTLQPERVRGSSNRSTGSKVDSKTESQFLNSTCQIATLLDNLNSVDDLSLINFGCDLVLYNRVPKCGSSAVQGTLQKVAKDNSFDVDNHKTRVYGASMTEQKRVATEISRQSRPLLYTRHMYFIPFHKLNIPQPFMINVVRHPVNRTISHYFYNTFGMGTHTRKEVEAGTTPRGKLVSCARTRGDRGGCNVFIPYFCGNDLSCYKRDKNALQRAMKNVEEYGMVIGISEDLRSFFWVLETLLPRFFNGSVEKYDTFKASMFNHTTTQAARDKYPIDETVLNRLPSLLGTEMELYEFLRQRFYRIKTKLESIVK